VTKLEVNQKISEKRDDWDHVEMTGGSNGCFDNILIPKDWHADANWPTLMRELLIKGFRIIANPRSVLIERDNSHTWYPSATTVEEAVCLEWLKI